MATVYNWLSSYEKSGGDNLSLIPMYNHSGGKGKLRVGEDIEETIRTIIDEYYKNEQRLTIKDIHEIFKARCYSEQMITGTVVYTPSYPTVNRAVKRIPEAELVLARNMPKSEKDKFRMKGNGVKVDAVLNRVEIDHTPIDLVLIDQDGLNPISRPYLTAAIDKCTRMILGFCVSFESPSYSTVMQCLSHSIKGKGYVKGKYPIIKNEWPAFGVPKTIVVDNGPEFHSEALIDACFQMGFLIEYAPSRTPEWKGSIERFLGTFDTGLAHKLPGTTRSNIKDRGEYNPHKEASIPMGVFLELPFHRLFPILRILILGLYVPLILYHN